MNSRSIITTTTPPNTSGKPTVRFKRSDFDTLVWEKGYDVHHDIALRCPCKEKGADNLSSCKNCGGSGWFFINRNKTKMVLQSMNQSTQFKDWSEENRGQVKITAMEEDNLSYMDRITLLNAEATYTQNVYPKSVQDSGSNVLLAYSIYDIVSMVDVFLFESAEVALKKLTLNADYTIEGDKGKIIFDAQYSGLTNMKVTVRYKYRPQYHVIDLTRNTMYSDVWDKSTLEGKKNVQFPVSAIGKIAHYTLDPKNLDGEYLFDNSYAQNTCDLF